VALNQISIRKYRSAILSEIVPLLIQYGQRYQNVDIMQYALQALSEIGDVSKQSQLHADVARAIAAAGIESDDIHLVISGIRSATEIDQKIRPHQLDRRYRGRDLEIAAEEGRSPISNAS